MKYDVYLYQIEDVPCYEEQQGSYRRRICHYREGYDNLEEVLYKLIREYHIPLTNLNSFDPADAATRWEPGIYANIYTKQGQKVEFYTCIKSGANYRFKWRYTYTAAGYEWYRYPRNGCRRRTACPGYRGKYQTYSQGMRQNASLETDYLEAREQVPDLRKWRKQARGESWIEDRNSCLYSRSPKSWKNRKIKRQWQKHRRL